MKASINCYTIKFKDNYVNISPGILSKELTPITVTTQSLILNETAVCRYAIEDKFRALPYSDSSLWVVFKECDALFYRFFTDLRTTDKKYVYIHIEVPEKYDIPSSLLTNVISCKTDNLLVKLPYKFTFEFMGNNFKIKKGQLLLQKS